MRDKFATKMPSAILTVPPRALSEITEESAFYLYTFKPFLNFLYWITKKHWLVNQCFELFMPFIQSDVVDDHPLVNASKMSICAVQLTNSNS